MSVFSDQTSPLGTLWYAGRVTHGRKSYRQKRFEKSLAIIKSNVLFTHLTDAQQNMSLRIMSQLLFGFTKIVNIQSSSIYQNSVQLLGSLHREMGIEKEGVDLDPAMIQAPLPWITLPENPYFMEYPFDVTRTMDAPNETQYNLLSATSQQYDITLSLPIVEPAELIQEPEGDAQKSPKDNVVGNIELSDSVDEFAPGPSRRPHHSTSDSHPLTGLNDQMVSTNDDNNMDDYMNWSGVFTDVGPDLQQNSNTTNFRSNLSLDSYQRVPVISSADQHHLHQAPTTAMSANAVDVNSSLWDISGLSISPPPATLPPAFPPPVLSAWMNENASLEMNQDGSVPVQQPVDSPVMSMQTDDYIQLVPRSVSPTPPLVTPRRRRRRRRRLDDLMDLDSTSLPLAIFTDIRSITMDHPAVEVDTIPTRGIPSRVAALKQLVSRRRAQMQQGRFSIGRPAPFWLRETRSARYGNTVIILYGCVTWKLVPIVIEQGRRLEQGRNRDPHSQDDFAFSNIVDDSDTRQFSSTEHSQLGQDNFDFQQMELVDDRPNRQSNTSTSSTRNQQPQGTRDSDSSFGNALTSSTASDRGRQGVGTTDEPNYNELLEMGVYMEPPDLSGRDFYDYLRLSTRDQDNVCIFDRIFVKGAGGSKRSEAALAFYYVLASSSAKHIRPEQEAPYGPLYLHLLHNNVT